MADEPEILDGPDPELAPAVDEKLPDVALAVHDPSDAHEVMLRMDEHDVQMLLSEVQSAALRKWIYKLPGNRGTGLTVHAVQDIVQRMNWTGKARIGLLLDEGGRPVLDVEVIEADEGDGPEPFWSATAFSKDEVSGLVLPGAAMEPQRMHKRDGSRPFDRFARTKAIQKATRNALGAHIPEEIEQTVIAMFEKDPLRVARIQTEAEAKLAELPPALEDREAQDLLAEARALYSDIVWPPARVEFPPAKFAAWVRATQHSHESLRELVASVEAERDRLREKYGAPS